MKANGNDLALFIRIIKGKNKDINNQELGLELAKYIENNPGCISLDESPNQGRYSYRTVGYGVFSLLGEFYSMGRIEIYDKEEDSGFNIGEGGYCMPFTAANQFCSFIESLKTDLPISFDIGSVKNCEFEVSEILGIPVEKLNDMETKKAYYKEKNKNNEKSIFDNPES